MNVGAANDDDDLLLSNNFVIFFNVLTDDVVEWQISKKKAICHFSKENEIHKLKFYL